MVELSGGSTTRGDQRRLTAPAGVKMHGPTREHVDGDPFQDDPARHHSYNGMSPSVMS